MPYLYPPEFRRRVLDLKRGTMGRAWLRQSQVRSQSTTGQLFSIVRRQIGRLGRLPGARRRSANTFLACSAPNAGLPVRRIVLPDGGW